MLEPTPPRISLSPPYRSLPLDKFKVCPLCSSLNALVNAECFVCGWASEFDHDPELILNALHELVLQCPAIIDIISRPASERKSLLHRMISFLKKPKHIDLSA